MIGKVGAAFACAVLARGAAAQDGVADNEDGRHIERIVVTGTGVSASTDETLQSIDVLMADELVEDFSGSLGDTLARLPGVSSTFFGPAAGRPVVRGLGGDRVRVLNNGVGLIDASTASPDHAVTADGLDAERVEILRGPAAIAYGGNAIGGVVNIIDGRIPTTPVDGSFDGQLVLGITSVDDGRLGAGRVRTGLGRLVMQLEASRRAAGDYEIPGFAESARLRAMEESAAGDDHEGHEAFGVIENSDFEFTTLGAGASYLRDWGMLGASVRDYDAEYGLPGQAHDGDDEGEEDDGEARLVMEQLRVDARGEVNLRRGPFDRAEFSIGWGDYQHAEIEGGGLVGTLFRNEGYEARFTMRNGDDGDRLSGSAGLQTSRRDFSAVGAEAFIQPVVTEDLGVFAAERLDLGGWGLEGGLRFEHRDLAAADGRDRGFDMVSASAGAFWRPSEDAFLGVSLSRTQRAPTDVELFGEGPHLATNAFEIGDPELGLETGWALDANYHHDHGPVSVQAGAFATLFENFVVLAPTGEEADGLPVFRYLQDDAFLWGGELLVDAELGALHGWEFAGDAAIDYVRARTDTLGNAPRIPPYSVTLGLEAETGSVTLRAEAAHAGAQRDLAAFELPTDAYSFYNISVVWAPIEDAELRLILEARNLTDEEGRAHASFLKDVLPLPGRSLGARMAARF